MGDVTPGESEIGKFVEQQGRIPYNKASDTRVELQPETAMMDFGHVISGNGGPIPQVSCLLSEVVGKLLNGHGPWDLQLRRRLYNSHRGCALTQNVHSVPHLLVLLLIEDLSDQAVGDDLVEEDPNRLAQLITGLEHHITVPFGDR